MTLPPACRRLLLACALATAVARPGFAAEAATPPTALTFMGTPYLHRWSANGQNDYTPLPQSDLAKWRDILTLQVYDGVDTGEKLSKVANDVLLASQKVGLIIRTNSLPATPGRPAQHMIVAVLSDVGVRTMVFTRFMLTPAGGLAVTYAHRIQGIKPDAEASAWFKVNDIPIEKALMAWTEIPSVPALRALPQASGPALAKP